MAIIKQKVTVTYELSIDAESGKILESEIVNKKSKSIDSVKEDSEPKLYLEDTKCRLNQAAIKLMNLEAGDKIDIKYEQDKAGTIPLIGKDEAFGTKGGNKLSKSYTIACRGIKNAELVKYGKEFNIFKHPNKEGLFVLSSGIEIKNPVVEEDINIDDLIEDTTEITSDFFKL